MSTFGLFLLIGLFILGVVKAYRVATRLAEEKKAKGCTTEDLISTTSAFDIACLLVFGVVIVVANWVFRKVMR